MQHHTKTKGDLAVFKVMLWLAVNEYMVMSPMTEHAPFDLVAYKDKEFLRIQVKYTSAYKDTVVVPFKQVWSDRNGRHTNHVDKDEIDLYAVYCPDTEEIYWVDPKAHSTKLTIRLGECRQKANVKFSKDFLTIKKT